MMIDFHTHIFSRRIRDHRQYYVDREPAFRILYESPKSRMVGADELVNTMDEQGVDVSVVFGFPWKDADTFQSENDYIMEAVHRYPDRLVGFACLDPFHEKAEDEVRRCIDGGLRGVGELAFYENGISDQAQDRLAPIMDICRKHRLPILIHTNEPVGHQYPGKSPNTLIQIYNLTKRFPENRIVLAHWGGGIFFYNLLKREVQDTLKNVYVDTAASPFLYNPRIYSIAMELLGPDKVLFGSDYPLIKPERYVKEMTASGMDGDTIKAIQGDNARQVLNINR